VGSASHNSTAGSSMAVDPGAEASQSRDRADAAEAPADSSSSQQTPGADMGSTSGTPSGSAKTGAKGKARPRKGVEVGPSAPVVGKKPARNKGCPCGSGRKWKGCCGAAAAAAERRQRVLLDQGAAAEVGLPATLATLSI
jgi:hypothetical protein